MLSAARPEPPAPQLTIPEVAELVDVSERTLRRWMAAGDGPPVYRFSGQCVRFDRAEVAAWIRSRRSTRSTRRAERAGVTS